MTFVTISSDASADRRSAVNSENAKGKAASGNDKSSKNRSRRIRKETLSEEDVSALSEPIANQDAESGDSSQTSSSTSTATSFEQIEAIYPKKASVGAYRDEALATWTNLTTPHLSLLYIMYNINDYQSSLFQESGCYHQLRDEPEEESRDLPVERYQFSLRCQAYHQGL